MTAAVALVCAVLGLLVGSFLNVVAHRVPAGESVVRPRSRCPGCATPIASWDNIPVVSWLLLRGRCRSCGEPISPRYPLVEAGTALLFALVGVRFGADPALAAYLVGLAGVVAVSLIDLDTFLIPKKIVWPVAAATAVLLAVAAAVDGDWFSLREAAIGAAAASGGLFVIFFISPKGMGFGDVRLAVLLGLLLGWISLPHVALGLFLSFLLGAVVGVSLIVAGRHGRKDRIPFGPSLAGGTIVAILAGRTLLTWYGL